MEHLFQTGGRAVKSTISQFFSLPLDSDFVNFVFEKYKTKDNQTIDITKFVTDIAPCCKQDDQENLKGKTFLSFFHFDRLENFCQSCLEVVLPRKQTRFGREELCILLGVLLCWQSKSFRTDPEQR